MRSYGARINFIKYMGDYAQSRGYAFGLRSRGPESAAYSGFRTCRQRKSRREKEKSLSCRLFLWGFIRPSAFLLRRPLVLR